MNWISRWKKIGIKVRQIFKKQPTGQEESNWKSCPQCKKITYLPDLISNSIKNRQNPVTNVGNMVRKLKDKIT